MRGGQLGREAGTRADCASLSLSLSPPPRKKKKAKAIEVEEQEEEEEIDPDVGTLSLRAFLPIQLTHLHR